jgi:hypothetical protein
MRLCITTAADFFLDCFRWQTASLGVCVPVSLFTQSNGDFSLMPPNKSLQATAMGHSVLTMIARLIIIIPSEARLPWLCLSSGR